MKPRVAVNSNPQSLSAFRHHLRMLRESWSAAGGEGLLRRELLPFAFSGLRPAPPQQDQRPGHLSGPSMGSVHLPSSWPALLPSCLRNSLANSSKSWVSFCSAMARSPKWEFYQGFNEMFRLYKYALLSNLPLNLVVFTKSSLTWRQRYHSLFTKHSLGATCSGMLGRQSSDNGKTLLTGSLHAGRDSKTKTKCGGNKAGKQGLARPQRRELLLQWGLGTPSTSPWGAGQVPGIVPGLGKPQEQARHVPALTELTV